MRRVQVTSVSNFLFTFFVPRASGGSLALLDVLLAPPEPFFEPRVVELAFEIRKRRRRPLRARFRRPVGYTASLGSGVFRIRIRAG
jgi:hypothetical protein